MSAPLTITLPIPDHRLSVNRVRTNQQFRTKLVNAHKDTAMLAALAKQLHPDRQAGDGTAMVRLNRARDEARVALA